MVGTNAETGDRIYGLDCVRAAIKDILTTPVGTRVGRRDYGSSLFLLVDAPMNDSTKTDIYAATVDALDKWLVDGDGNKILSVSKVSLVSSVRGSITISLIAKVITSGEILNTGVTINV